MIDLNTIKNRVRATKADLSQEQIDTINEIVEWHKREYGYAVLDIMVKKDRGDNNAALVVIQAHPKKRGVGKMFEYVVDISGDVCWIYWYYQPMSKMRLDLEGWLS
jgi:hypothetical protein